MKVRKQLKYKYYNLVFTIMLIILFLSQFMTVLEALLKATNLFFL